MFALGRQHEKQDEELMEKILTLGQPGRIISYPKNVGKHKQNSQNQHKLQFVRPVS